MPIKCYRVGRIVPLAILMCLCLLAKQPGRAADDPSAVQSLAISELKTMLEQPDTRHAVVVMAAWCAPCIQELPDLVALHRKYGRDGLNFIGLSIDYGGPQAIAPIVRTHKVTFPVYWTGEAAIEALNIEKIPLLILIKDGEIEKRLVGMRSRKELEAELVEFIK